MNETETIEEKKEETPIFKAWILFYLVSTVTGLIVGGIMGFIVTAFIDLVLGSDFRFGYIGGQVLGFFVAIPISFIVYRWSVKEYILKHSEQDSAINSDTPLRGESS